MMLIGKMGFVSKAGRDEGWKSVELRSLRVLGICGWGGCLMTRGLGSTVGSICWFASGVMTALKLVAL